MLTFKTIEDIRHIRHGDFLGVSEKLEPHPYPGRYPTRVAWYIAAKIPVWYMGRPNLLHLTKPQRAIGKIRCLILGWEFDRGGIVATWQAGHYGIPSATLWRHYHPFQRPGTWFEGFLPWFEVSKHGGRVIYSPGNMDMLQKLQQDAVNVQLDAFANVIVREAAPAEPPPNLRQNLEGGSYLGRDWSDSAILGEVRRRRE